MALSVMPLQLDHRQVIDKTGVDGQFDFDLKFPTDAGDSSDLRDPAADLEKLQGALRSVGLDLVQTRGTEEVLIVDHAERPSGN